jgi:Ni/Co efflux regulator RcnB
MRKLILATVAAILVTAPMTASVRAEDTTVIKKDNDLGDRTTIIKKHDDADRTIVRQPDVDKKVIIHKDGE